MERESINTLKILGLSTYEATAYVTLTNLISATAVNISENSAIPRSKIYDVLKSLFRKGFIEVENGRPLIYHVNSPLEVLKREKELINSKLEKATFELNEIYENEISQVQAPIWRVFGVDRIIKKELEIINRSKKSINMRIGFLFEEEAEKLIKAFKNKSSNVEINILASQYCYLNDNKIDIINIFKENEIPIVKANIPFVKMIISDSKEMIHTYTKFSGDKKMLFQIVQLEYGINMKI